MHNESHSQMAGLSARPAGRKGLQNRVGIVSPAANRVSHSARRQSGVEVAHTSHNRKRRNIAVPTSIANDCAFRRALICGFAPKRRIKQAQACDAKIADRCVPDRFVLAMGKSRPKKGGNVSPMELDVVRDQWDC